MLAQQPLQIRLAVSVAGHPSRPPPRSASRRLEGRGKTTDKGRARESLRGDSTPMRTLLRLITFAAALALAIPSLTAQDKPKEKDKDNKTERKDNASRLPTIRGTLENPGGEKGTLVLKVTETYPQRSGKQIRWKQQHKTVELKAADDLIVRTAAPPPARDGQGKPRPHTAQELKELKGAGNLPGYPAEPGSLKKGQSVVCYYEPAKPAKKADSETPADTKPRVRMIVIVTAP